MKNNDDLFIWGDNWWIESDRAWFVWGMENILLCIDLITRKCESAVCIPDDNPKKFRLTPYCIKYDKYIFCLPGLGESIWVYDLEDQYFSKIDIDNPNKGQMGFEFWVWEDKLFAVSTGELRKILEINIVQKKIDNYYTICEEGRLARSVMVNNAIYILSAESNMVYQFDLKTKAIKTHTLPDIDGKLWTICFDGEEFWLSGFQKEVYVWNPNTNMINLITNFPKGFGVYDFTKETTTGEVDCVSEKYEYHVFNFSVAAGNRIWFIPYNANKILYADKGMHELHSFEIDEENETKESIMARTSLGYKYLLGYLKDDRYLGLFSIKNNCMLEIDTVEMRYAYKRYDYCTGIDDNCLKEYAKQRGSIFYEANLWHRSVYKELISVMDSESRNISECDIGKDIYKKISTDMGK